MKAIYLKVSGLLKEVEALKLIDLDRGQLEVANPAVKYPCALINISYPETSDLTGKEQRVRCLVTIRLAFSIATDNTSNMFGNDKVDAALSYFDTVDDVYRILQGYTDDEVEEFSRKQMLQEKRHDALKVTTLVFETYFDDLTADE